MVDASLRAGIVSLIRQLRDRHGIGFLVIILEMAGAVADQLLETATEVGGARTRR